MEYFNNYKLKSVPSSDAFLARVMYSNLSNTSVFFSIKASNTHALLSNTIELKIKAFNDDEVIKEYLLMRKQIPANSTVELIEQKLVLTAGERLFVTSSAGSTVPVDIFACAVERYPAPSGNPFASPLPDPDLPEIPPFQPDPDFPDLPVPTPRIPPDPWEPTPDNPVCFLNITGQGTEDSTVIKDESPYHFTVLHETPGSPQSMEYDRYDPWDGSGGTTTLKAAGKYIKPDIPMSNNGSDFFYQPYTLEFSFGCTNNEVSSLTRCIAAIGNVTYSNGQQRPLVALVESENTTNDSIDIYLYIWKPGSSPSYNSYLVDRQFADVNQYYFEPYRMAMFIDPAQERFVFSSGESINYGYTHLLDVSLPIVKDADHLSIFFGGHSSAFVPGASQVHYWDILASLNSKYTFTSSINTVTDTRLFNIKKY